MEGGWGAFGGAMGLWGLLSTGPVLAVPLLLIDALAGRRSEAHADQPVSALRERHARGERSEAEDERRRVRLRRTAE